MSLNPAWGQFQPSHLPVLDAEFERVPPPMQRYCTTMQCLIRSCVSPLSLACTAAAMPTPIRMAAMRLKVVSTSTPSLDLAGRVRGWGWVVEVGYRCSGVEPRDRGTACRARAATGAAAVEKRAPLQQRHGRAHVQPARIWLISASGQPAWPSRRCSLPFGSSPQAGHYNNRYRDKDHREAVLNGAIPQLLHGGRRGEACMVPFTQVPLVGGARHGSLLG